MLAKVPLSFLSKVFSRRYFQQVSKFCYLRRGYCATLKNSGYFELAKQAVNKTRILAARKVNSKNGEVLLFDKEKKTGIFSVLWETVLVVFRIIEITSVISALLTFYWITRLFGLNIFPVIYLKALEFLGPTFVKLGQWMSTRRDLYPEELCARLSRLQRATSAHSWRYTRCLLEAAYGPDWRRLFVEFETVPVGSGCCAQVHRALLDPSRCAGTEDVRRDARAPALVEIAEYFCLGHFADYIGKILHLDTEKEVFSTSSNDLRPVAVKILHPCVKERLKRDLSILRFFSKCLTHLVPSLEWLSVTDCINEFSQIMEKQVDLELEAQNLETFSQHFSTKSEVCFPQPFYNLSYNQILVETFHEGRPINDYLYETNCALRHQLAKIGLNTVFKMIFEDNFVHCDLHPGNILVQESPDRASLESSPSPRIVILDCGLVTELSETCRRNFRQVFQSVAAGDGKKAADLMMNHSTHDSPDPDGFIETIDKIVKRHLRKGVKLKNMNVGHIMSELFAAMVRYQVKQDGSFSSVILSIAVIEGLGRSLDPGIDLIRELSPYLIAAEIKGF